MFFKKIIKDLLWLFLSGMCIVIIQSFALHQNVAYHGLYCLIPPTGESINSLVQLFNH